MGTVLRVKREIRNPKHTKGSLLESHHNNPQETVHAKVPSLDIPELHQCVHCGLCLNQCPTYRVLRLEPASPRGRIHLVNAAAEGRIELGDRFKEHIWRYTIFKKT